MVSQSMDATIVAIAADSLEHQLTASLHALRELAARCGDDDYYEEKARAMLERRPLVMLAVALPGKTVTWSMEPGSDAVLVTEMCQPRDPETNCRGEVTTTITHRTYLLETIMGHVSWLVKEQTGQSLDEIGAFRNR